MISEAMAYIMNILTRDQEVLYLTPITKYNNRNLDEFYDFLKDKLPLSVVSDSVSGMKRDSAELFEDISKIPYLVVKGGNVLDPLVNRFIPLCKEVFGFEFGATREVQLKSHKTLPRRLGFIQ